jgi:DNA-binding NarL/FixJ family response regulator
MRQLGPRTPVVVLTEARSEDVVRDCLRAGALAYVLKSDPVALLLESVRLVLLRKPFLTPEIARILVTDLFVHKRQLHRRTEELTAREREVLQLLAEGRTNKEVARTLGIGPRTVETHRMNLMAKLDCRSIAQLVRYAVRNQLVCA